MSVEQDLINYISSELAGSETELGPDTNLIDVVDSTAVTELVVWIEGKYEFDVEIDDITPERFGSVRKLVEYIDENIKKA